MSDLTTQFWYKFGIRGSKQLCTAPWLMVWLKKYNDTPESMLNKLISLNMLNHQNYGNCFCHIGYLMLYMYMYIKRNLRLMTIQMLQNELKGLIILTLVWSLMRMVDFTIQEL